MDRLLEHERFKNAAEMLAQKRLDRRERMVEPADLKRLFPEKTTRVLTFTLFDLVKAFGEILERAKNRPIYEVETADVTVADMIRYFKDQFIEAGPIGRFSLCASLNGSARGAP